MNSGTTATPTPAGQRDVFIQLALVTILVASFIWIGRDAFAGSSIVFGVLLILILVWSHRRRGDSLRDIGFRLDTARRTALTFVPIAIAIVSLTLAAGLWMHSLRFPPVPAALGMLTKLILFGIAQQYVLLGFYHRGIASLVPAPQIAILLTAIVFAAFHVPNPFLVVVTFFAALIAAAVYRHSPNLWVSGIVHGLISFVLYYALPTSVTGGLRVGPEY